MKITANAGELAAALALSAASLSGDKVHRFLDVVRLSAAGDTLTAGVDFMLTLDRAPCRCGGCGGAELATS